MNQSQNKLYWERKKKREAKLRAKKQIEKMMGKNYFTNMQEIMLKTAIELSERKGNV
jgi:hypothetical protein